MPTPETPERPSADEEPIVRPTWAPIAMAMGVAMTAWGLIALSLNINALLAMTAAGLGLSAWALTSWIREIVRNWEASR
ncbi:MAG: hypothetical protein KDA44_00695 [Planctomycetales bacterium]|nr:hypothetical protein [Planctomycetales bacterium]